jgi:hypothetical protein
MVIDLKKFQLGIKALIYPLNHVASSKPISSEYNLSTTPVSHSKSCKEHLKNTHVLVGGLVQGSLVQKRFNNILRHFFPFIDNVQGPTTHPRCAKSPSGIHIQP